MQLEFPQGIATGSFGLFNPAFDPLPGSFGSSGETIASALTRLQSRFKSLLISRILRLVLNAETAELKVSLEVGTTRSRGIPIRSTTRGQQRSTDPLESSFGTTNPNGIPDIQTGETINIKLKNGEAQDLYMSLLVIDAESEVDILFPQDWDRPEADSLVPAGQRKSFPTLKAIPPRLS